MFLVGYIGAPPTMGSPAAKVPCVTVIAGAPIRAAATVALRKMLRFMSLSFGWIDPESAEIIEGTDAGVNEFQRADHRSVNACVVQLEPLSRRQVSKRPNLSNTDRFLFVWFYHWFPSVLSAIAILRPETIIRWHRAGFSRTGASGHASRLAGQEVSCRTEMCYRFDRRHGSRMSREAHVL